MTLGEGYNSVVHTQQQTFRQIGRKRDNGRGQEEEEDLFVRSTYRLSITTQGVRTYRVSITTQGESTYQCQHNHERWEHVPVDWAHVRNTFGTSVD